MSDKRSQSRHEKLALTVNRKALLQFLQTTLSKPAPEQSRVCLIILDIRDFRELNHSFGEDCGDTILQAIYKRLINISEAGSSVYYLGNDEFCIVLDSIMSAGIAVIQTEAALSIFKQIFEWNNHSLKVTVNAGVAYNYESHQDANQLLYDAEIALKQAKQLNAPYQILGKHDQSQSDKVKWEMLESLHKAISEDELTLYYQPKVNLLGKDTNKSDAEVLVRWQNQIHGLISPATTLPLIEHLGSETDLLKWLLSAALKNLHNLGCNHRVSVNVPAKSVTTPELLEIIIEALEIWPVEPSCLTIEINEDFFIQDKEKAFDYLSKIRALGVRVAIYDFGTGYSSLAYFKHIPADELKIDQAFIQNMLTSQDDRNIVKFIIELAHSFNLTVVAEGAEDKETISLLKNMRCDYVQGFAIAKPMPYSEYLTWVKQ
jgi:diguanylate cyclase (GGDEF)-like protein